MNRSTWTVVFVLVVSAFAASIWLYPGLPERIPTHWNIKGEVDGYGSRGTIFLMPGFMAFMAGLFAALPWLSPKQFELDATKSTYRFIVLLTISLFAYLHVVILYATIHPTIDIGRMLMAGIMVMFALLGIVLGKVKRNFYIGVRTPWTLASERVWDEVHRRAGPTFVVCGLTGTAMTLSPIPPYYAFIPLAVAAIAPILHSLLLYKRLQARGEV